jgi:hypothetical protein
VLLAFHRECFLAQRAGQRLSYQMAPILGSRPIDRADPTSYIAQTELDPYIENALVVISHVY